MTYEKFENYFEKYDITTKDIGHPNYFAGVIRIVQEEYGLSDEFISDEFAVSPSTVQRWSRGRSLPIDYVRPVVIERLEKIILKNID
jgi:hypothetical protein